MTSTFAVGLAECRLEPPAPWCSVDLGAADAQSRLDLLAEHLTEGRQESAAAVRQALTDCLSQLQQHKAAHLLVRPAIHELPAITGTVSRAGPSGVEVGEIYHRLLDAGADVSLGEIAGFPLLATVDARSVIGISATVVVFVNYLLHAGESTVVLRFVAPVMEGRSVLIRSVVREIARVATALRIITDCERAIAQSGDNLSQNG